jgi:NAD(P)-dependent dehydrogenase (short-subunit alcohol dehydrogenase family)
VAVGALPDETVLADAPLEAASRAGLAALVRGLAAHYECRRIRVNGLPAACDPQALRRAVVFLVSDQSARLTGACAPEEPGGE